MGGRSGRISPTHGPHLCCGGSRAGTPGWHADEPPDVGQAPHPTPDLTSAVRGVDAAPTQLLETEKRRCHRPTLLLHVSTSRSPSCAIRAAASSLPGKYGGDVVFCGFILKKQNDRRSNLPPTSELLSFPVGKKPSPHGVTRKICMQMVFRPSTAKTVISSAAVDEMTPQA